MFNGLERDSKNASLDFYAQVLGFNQDTLKSFVRFKTSVHFLIQLPIALLNHPFVCLLNSQMQYEVSFLNFYNVILHIVR